ncbi:MAG: hypothetical protein OEZ13_10870 [Spirochaetia bacterium]|nr:hypothetical protein [Spirochaetia bacterium]
MIKIKFSKYLISGIFISFMYNVLWLGIFIYFADLYAENIIIFVIIFLLVYLLFANPLKDLLYLYYMNRYAFSSKWKVAKIEKNLSNIYSIDDLLQFLSSLLKLWNLNNLILILEEPFLHKFSFIRNKKYKRQKLNKRTPSSFIDRFLDNPWAENISNLREEEKKVLKNYKSKCAVPILYRDLFLGCIFFEEELEPAQLDTAAQISQKSGIIIQNEILKNRLSPAVHLQKEFDLARKIEEYLSEFDELNFDEFKIQKEHLGWREKTFPAIFETTFLPYKTTKRNEEEEDVVIFLLCKLSDNLQRAKAIQLFSAQGCFLGIGEKSGNLKIAAHRLHKALRNQTFENILLDGYLAKFSNKKTVEILPFGKSLKIEVDQKIQNIENSAPLGSSESKYGAFVNKIKYDEKITLYIRDYPLVSVKRI